MSKPASNAAAQYHKCPKTSDEIRVKGFAFCPFCGAAINADGDHNVVVPPDNLASLRAAQQAAQPRPEALKPEPAKPEAPAATPGPEAKPVKTAEELEKLINETFGKPAATVKPATTAVPPTRPQKTPKPEVRKTKQDKPPNSVVPFVIFLVLIGAGGLAARNAIENQPTQAAETPLPEEPAADPSAVAIDMTDTGSKRNPNITTTEKALVWRPVDDGLVRQIRYNYANIRTLPTLDSKIVGQLNQGDLIEPTGRLTDLRGAEHGEWYRVDNPAGYVRFGNTKAATASAPKAVEIRWSAVEPGLRVQAKITLRIRSTPSRSDNSNVTDSRIAQDTIFSPAGIANDIGRDAGKQWYRVTEPVVGYVAKWETNTLKPVTVTPPTVRSAAPGVDASDGGSRTDTPSTRARDAQRRRDDAAASLPSASPAPAPAGGSVGRPAADAPRVIRRAIFTAQPTDADRRAAYPARAGQRANETNFDLTCTVHANGTLACVVNGGQNIDEIFITAAMTLASKYRVADRDMDGFATAGRILVLPMIFKRPN